LLGTFRSLSITLLVLLASTSITSAQSGENRVQLKVVNNGRLIRPPRTITLRTANESFVIPVRGGFISFPPGLAGESYSVETYIAGSRIGFSGLPPSALKSDWTLRLASSDFGHDYSYALPARYKVRSACLLQLDPPNGDGTILAFSKCRKYSR
jgi:hypothetical protein